MADKKDRIVDGFCFTSKEEADIARLELEKIEMLKQRMDYSNAPFVLSVYNRAIMNRTFRTPVGYQYLSSLREWMLNQGVSESEMSAIPLMAYFGTVKSPAEKIKSTSAPKKKTKQNSISLVGSVLLNIILILLVGVMFLIALNSDNPNIINYKTQIINEYADWEQDLKDKEDELRAWEKELREKEEDVY